MLIFEGSSGLGQMESLMNNLTFKILMKAATREMSPKPKMMGTIPGR